MKNARSQYAMFLYYMAKLWGLAPFAFLDERASLGSSVHVIYPMILSTLCIPEIIMIVTERSRVAYEGQTEVTYVSDVVSLYLGNLGSVLFLITFVLKRRKIVGILNALHDLDGLLGALGAELDYEKYFKSRAIRVSVVSCVTTVVIYGTNVSYAFIANLFSQPWMNYSLIVGSWITLVQYHGIFVFVVAMDFFQKRYHQLNHLFSNVCTGVDVVTAEQRRLCIGRSDPKPLERLRKIEELYVNLREVTDSLLEIFYLPIMATLAFYFTTILNISYYVYVEPSNFVNVYNYEANIALISASCWIAVALAELFAIAAICSSVQETANSTTTLLHKTWLKYHPTELKDESVGFRLSPSQSDEAMENVYAIFLFYYAKFWGLAPFSWTLDRAYVGSSFEVLYPLILALLSVPQFYFTVVNRSDMDYAGRTTMTSVIDGLSNHLGNLGGGLCLVTFAFKRRKLVQITNALYRIDTKLSFIGVEQNYEESSKRQAIIVGLSSAVNLIVAYGSSIIYWITMGSVTTLWMGYSFFIGTWIRMVHHHIDLYFVIAMEFVRTRYAQLNDRLTNVCVPEYKLHLEAHRYGLPINRKILVVASVADMKRNHVSSGSVATSKRCDTLRKIAELTDDLHEVTDSIVEVVSLPIFVILSYYFTLLLTMIYHFFVTTPIAYNTGDYVTIAQLSGTSFWLVAVLCELFAIGVICSLTQKTANSAPALLHRIWNQYHAPELKDEIQMLSLQLLQRPLTISAFGFFSLDYSYLYKIFCAVVAYFIIMIQLDTSKVEPSLHPDSLLNGTRVQ